MNDVDAYLANFWRALQADPEEVARCTDHPVNEADLHARHLWLVKQADFRERMRTDPDYYDAKIAGWWVWGLCAWIGSGWCDVSRIDPSPQLPHLGNAGWGVHRKLPHLGNAGRGVHRKLPHLGDAGRGLSIQLPHLGGTGMDSGRGVHGASLSASLSALADRLRRVRVACGDWSRVVTDSVTWRHGLTGVFLDPPYDDGAAVYSSGGQGISTAVREWAVANGGNPLLRIALCGYEGEHEMPASWRCVPWKARGGYGSQRQDGTNENAGRERIWFSEHCIDPRHPVQQGLDL